MKVEPYLMFDGRTEEAIGFYGKAIGATVEMMMRFKDAPEGHCPGGEANGEKIMHSALRVGDSMFMASDGDCKGSAKFEGISLALQVADMPSAEKTFAALSDGGQVIMPLTKTFWSPGFGMLTDKFGVTWMINVES